MRRRKRSNGGEESSSGAGIERWLLSYADFITLLMVFFILLYAMSKVDVAKYSAIAESLSVILTGASLSQEQKPGVSVITEMTEQQLNEELSADIIELKQLEEVKELLEEFIASENLYDGEQIGEQTATGLGNYLEIIQQERGLVISLKDTLLFSSGSDMLTPQAKSIIKQLGSALIKVPNYIRIEGHTDNLSINTAKFPSNWELSALRATSVMHVLQEEAGISPDRLSVIGYGEYRPLVPNIDAASQARNRRVDVVILKKKYDDFEPRGVQP